MSIKRVGVGVGVGVEALAASVGCCLAVIRLRGSVRLALGAGLPGSLGEERKIVAGRRKEWKGGWGFLGTVEEKEA